MNHYVGKVTFVNAWFTTTIPAFLSLSGHWDRVNDTVALIVASVLVIYFVIAYFTNTPAKKIKSVEEPI